MIRNVQLCFVIVASVVVLNIFLYTFLIEMHVFCHKCREEAHRGDCWQHLAKKKPLMGRSDIHSARAQDAEVTSRPRFPVDPPPLGQTLPDIVPIGNVNRNLIIPSTGNWSEPKEMKRIRQIGVVEKIPVEQLPSVSHEQLILMYHSFLDNTDIICHRKLRMGKVGDGGWEICDDIQWRPISPCIIYSFGINYDFSFDDDAAKLYGCEVFSFDPSMKTNTYRRSDRVMFYKVGIGGTSGPVTPAARGWLLHSFSNIRQMLNHTKKVIDVVKMDVEQSEWPSVRTMLKESQLDSVRQLLIEFHSGDNVSQLRSNLQLLGDLEKAGFRKFYVSKNFHCQRPASGFPVARTSCYEIYYVNSLFLRRA